MSQSPTIGRIVHYTFSKIDRRRIDQGGCENFVYCGQTYTVPAMIVRVWSDTCVNLKVFHDGLGEPLWKESVLHSDAARPDAECWQWPPRT